MLTHEALADDARTPPVAVVTEPAAAGAPSEPPALETPSEPPTLEAPSATPAFEAPSATPAFEAPSASLSAAAPPQSSLLKPAEMERGGRAPALTAPLAGALSAFLPMVVGSLLVARDDNPALQRAGVTAILSGFVAGPWVAHAGSGQWGRAAAFGAASLAASTAAWIVMEARDPFDPRLGNHKRLPFGVLFTAAFSIGALGVVDGFLGGPSRREP